MPNPRQLALIALRDVYRREAYTDIALDRVLSSTESLSSAERGLACELVYGTVRRQRSLDALINQLGKKKAHQQPPDLRLILHLGLYQLRYLSQISDAAAVNTSVELAKANGLKKLTGAINGILRQYIRLATHTSEPLQLPENPIECLGILHSFPNRVIEIWREQLDLDETEQLCAWFNQPPAIDLRVNPLQTSVAEVEAAMQGRWEAGEAGEKEAGTRGRGDAESFGTHRSPRQRAIPSPRQERMRCSRSSRSERESYTPHSSLLTPHPSPSTSLPQALRLTGGMGTVRDLPGFSEGWWTIQDSSAQLVSHLLDPQPGEVIIDACAAPGGKTTHIAELMEDRGTIWACDRAVKRLRKVEENAQRLQLKSIQICPGDSRHFSQFTQNADRVLIDAPCSGLGTLHRRPDLRWRENKAQELSVLQKELIEQAATWVKPGGILVYATCTLHWLENEGVVQAFLDSHPDWQIQPPLSCSPAASFTSSQGWIKVWSHRHQMDGFFMVKLKAGITKLANATKYQVNKSISA
jgi:16S rRNA (cytosine967-C5)-methyltransferase